MTAGKPAYINNHPEVLFDQAHFNVHTSGGRFKAFADLIALDGYRVIPNGIRSKLARFRNHPRAR